MEKTEYIPGELSPKKAGAVASAYLNAANGFKGAGAASSGGTDAVTAAAFPQKADSVDTVSAAPKAGASPANAVSTVPKTGAVPANVVSTAPKAGASPANAVSTVPKTGAVPANVVSTAPKAGASPANAVSTVPKTGAVPANVVPTAPKTDAVSTNAVPVTPKTGVVSTNAAATVPKTGANPAMTKKKTAAQPKSASEKPSSAPKPAQHLSDSAVMKHTAGVWRYREITDDGTEMHSESHYKHTRTDFADILAARVRGKKHKHDGTNCDDYFETAVTDDCVICAVCDGAGSRRLSRIGSRVCCETAVSYLKKELAALFAENSALKEQLSAEMNAPEFLHGCGKIAALVQESARRAYAALTDVFHSLEVDAGYTSALGRAVQMGDLSATFLAAVVVPLVIEEKRQALTVSVQIGDGCICTLDTKAGADSCLRLMGEADSGAFSGETDFISEKNTRPEVIGGKTRVGRSAADIVMLMTDGVADDYFPAQPMMKRLYLDLCLNGILPMSGELSAAEDPAPVFYASVSMSRQSVALQYAKQLLSDGGREEMDGLWEKRDMLRCHSLEAYRMNIGDTPEERLCVWLDNYNERGSFDDRTLAVIRLGDLKKNL